MGGYFSKIGSDPYYANFEKSFQRLTKDIDRFSAQKDSRLAIRSRVGQFVAVWSTVIFVFIAIFAAWVHRQPEGTYTAQEHAVRVSPILIEPICAYSLHCTIQWLLRIRDKRLGHRLNTLQTKMKRLVHDLKDSTRYDKTQKLLEKYDPEYVPSSPSKGLSNSTHVASASTPGMRHRNVSNAQAQGNPGMMSPLAGLQRGVGAAGSRMAPLLGSLANMVGDNPALMDTLKDAQAEADRLKCQVEKLQRENQRLQLCLRKDAPEQDPGTPRSTVHGEEDIIKLGAHNDADVHQQHADSSNEPTTPARHIFDDGLSTRSGHQSSNIVTTQTESADSKSDRHTTMQKHR